MFNFFIFTIQGNYENDCYDNDSEYIASGDDGDSRDVNGGDNNNYDSGW